MNDIVELLRRGLAGPIEAVAEIERLREWKDSHPYSEIDMDMHVEAVTKDMRAEIERLSELVARRADELSGSYLVQDWLNAEIGRLRAELTNGDRDNG